MSFEVGVEEWLRKVLFRLDGEVFVFTDLENVSAHIAGDFLWLADRLASFVAII